MRAWWVRLRAGGVTPEWYTIAVPTKHQRIPVVRDPALEQALTDAEQLLGPATHSARRVHELALRGVEALKAEDAARREGLARLAALSTAREAPFDRDLLLRLDDEAWGGA